MTKGFEKLALYEAEKAKLLALTHRDVPKAKGVTPSALKKSDSEEKTEEKGWLEALFTF